MKKLEKFTCKTEWSSHHEELKNIQEFDNCFIASDGYRIGIIKKETTDSTCNNSRAFKNMLETCDRFLKDNDLSITVDRKELLTQLNELFKECKGNSSVSRKSQCNIIINIHSNKNFDMQVSSKDLCKRSDNNNYSIAFNLQYFIDAIDLFTPDKTKELELKFNKNSNTMPMTIETDKRSAFLCPVR